MAEQSKAFANYNDGLPNLKGRPESSESKLNTYSDGFKVLKTIWCYYGKKGKKGKKGKGDKV
jgi:hypothetical protein